MSIAVLVGSCEEPDRLERRSEGPVGISNAQPVQLEQPGSCNARARGRYLPKVAKKTKPILDTRDQLLRSLAGPTQRPILRPLARGKCKPEFFCAGSASTKTPETEKGPPSFVATLPLATKVCGYM